MSESSQLRAPWLLASPLVRRLVSTQLACSGLLGGVLLLSSGCGLFKGKARVFTPPPVAAKVRPTPLPPVELSVPPEFNGEVNPNVEIIAGLPTLPAPPPAPATTKPLPPAPPKQQATVEVNPPPVVVSPKPAAIISAAERQVLTRELDDKTGRVRTALARVQGRRLSSDLQTLATQAQTFLTQAESARTAQDLVTAVSLARTAANFAAELIDRLP